MGDDTQIQAKRKSSIKLNNGVFRNVLYVPSLDANVLSIYQMAHTSSPKQVMFGLASMEITYISTGKIIAKCVANHASKAYEFSHFLPYSDLAQPQLPFKRGGKNIVYTFC